MTSQSIKDRSGGSYRSIFMDALIDAAEETPEILLLVADLGRAMGASRFSTLFPDRCFQLGIAEQNLIGVAAGMASCGKIPFAATFAPFATMRCLEQIRDDVAYMSLNVKIVGTDSGVSLGTLGTTHYAIEDIGLLRSIPNMVILSPADGAELYQAVFAAAKHKGPVYIRVGGSQQPAAVYQENCNFTIGRAVTLTQGNDAAIIATGTMVERAVQAAEILLRGNIRVRVVNMHTIKPLDDEAVLKAATETGAVVTIEEHNIVGGLGTAVADVMAQNGVGRLLKLGLPDQFSHRIAPYSDMLARYGLSPEEIVVNAENFICKRRAQI
ncbi:MAG: transketolase C-terminal domain-containing protein [Clostridia bacterium]|nr:transketolase C-terminal domain-containing protein [Clostridia bacterium]